MSVQWEPREPQPDVPDYGALWRGIINALLCAAMFWVMVGGIAVWMWTN